MSPLWFEKCIQELELADESQFEPPGLKSMQHKLNAKAIKTMSDQLHVTEAQKKRSLGSAQQTKLFEARPSAASNTRQTESKTRVEQDRSWDLEKAIKRMKDEDFFQKEYARDLKKRQKERDAYMREAALRRNQELEEVKSLQDAHQ